MKKYNKSLKLNKYIVKKGGVVSLRRRRSKHTISKNSKPSIIQSTEIPEEYIKDIEDIKIPLHEIPEAPQPSKIEFTEIPEKYLKFFEAQIEKNKNTVFKPTKIEITRNELFDKQK
jgi:hypothetical protein